MTESRFLNLIRNRNVAFITVKNRDYIRVSQIERFLAEHASDYEIYSSDKTDPMARMLDLNWRIDRMDFNGIDAIVVGFLPQLVWKKILRKVGRLSKKPVLIADFFLSLYDTIVLDRRLLGDGNPLTGILRKMDKRVLAEADLVITDTKADAEFFSREYNISYVKFEVMYLEADPEFVRIADDKCRPRLSSCSERKSGDPGVSDSDSYEVIYFGTGLPLQGTDIVLESFVKAAHKSQHVTFTYVGSTRHIPDRTKRNASVTKSINLIDWLSQEELYSKVAKANLCIVGHFNPCIDKADRTIPGKAFIYEALGKKMILGNTEANHEYFEEDERHIFVRRGSAAALAESICDCAGI